MAKKTTGRKKSSGAKRPAARRGGMAHWYVLGAAVIGGILYMDNRTPAPESAATGIRTASIERKEKKPARETVAVARVKPKPAERAIPEPDALPAFSGKWFICTTQTDYCVLDGGSILYAGRKVKLADIDAPAIADARCDGERARGGDAKLRLRELLNEGNITLAASGRAGAHVVLRDGQSIGQRLVREGLAKPWTGRHRSWCG